MQRLNQTQVDAWIMQETGMGPGVGDVHYLVDASSAYYNWLRDDLRVETSKIHFTPQVGYDHLTANRNDVLCVFPATYGITSKLTWAKAQTHMLGVGNPTWRQGGKIRIQNTGVAEAATVDVTASGVFFGGLNITQSGANSACLTALRLSSTYFHAKKLDLRGHLASQVAAIEQASSLEFAAASSAGFGSTFEDCNIGTSSGSKRTAASAAVSSGVVNFAVASQSGSPAGYAEFKRCRFLSWSEDADCNIIRLESVYASDRYLMFEDCWFYNFWTNKTDQLDVCFYGDFGTIGSPVIMLKGSTAGFGFDKWTASATSNLRADMPIVGTAGGLGRLPNGTVGN